MTAQPVQKDPQTDAQQIRAEMSTLLSAVGAQRDKQAFARLFEYFAPRLKSFLMRGGLTPDQAEEIAQDSMLAVWRKAHLYNPQQAAAGTWIFTIARNKRIDHFRKNSRIAYDNIDASFIEDDSADPSAHTDAEQENAIMGEAIKNLPEDQAKLIQKAFFEEKTHDSIAKELDLPLGTVKSRIRLAMNKLRKNKNIQDIWP